MKRLGLILFFLCNIAIAILAPEIRDAAYSTWNSLPPTEHQQWLDQRDFAQRVDIAFAANPMACGNGSCGTVEPWITSTATPINFFADKSTGSTGFQVSNATTGTLSTTVPELGFTNTNPNTGTNSCPDAGTGNLNLMFLVNNSNSATHGFRVFCNGSASVVSSAATAFTVTGNQSVSGTLTLAGTSPETFSNTLGATITSGATSGPALTWSLSAGITPASTLNYVWQGGTGGATNILTLAGNGNLISPIGNYTNTAGNIVDTAGNFIANGTANATGELISGNGTAVTGAKGVGAIVANGPFYQFTNCVQSTSNASPSLLTLPAGSWGCKLTSGSASATVFNITYPGSVTLSNAPFCIFTDKASGITTEPTCSTSTTVATITYAVAPGAVALGDLIIIGNGI